MTNQDLISQLTQRAQAAYAQKDFDEVQFYFELQYRFKQLLLVANCVARLNEQPRTDEAWEALFQALDDAYLLTHAGANEDEDEPKGAL